MNILMVSPEMEPFAQTGGLGDVVGALPAFLAGQGHRVSVVLPLYRAVEREKHGLKPFGRPRSVPLGDKSEKYGIQRAALGAVDVYFIDKPAYFDRDDLYSYDSGDFADNAERFIFFSRAAVGLAAGLRPAPHVVHSHDWQTGLVPVYLDALKKDYPPLSKAVSVFTIHNLGYQGLFPESRMQLTGLGRSYYTPEGLEYYGRMSLLKGGIVYADAVTTVSEGYAAEIQTEEYGCGLHSLLHSYRDKLTGILNGADYRAWDPAADSLLPCSYSPADLSGKARCKSALQQAAGLPRRPGAPLIGMVTRLAEQKGFDLLAGAVEELMRLDLQVVVLGRGDTRYEELVQEFSRRFPEHFACRIAFDKRLSHLVQAGSDFFLMPSRYEPCGLSQIYSLRYGTVPLVRATGGLEDTVVDVRSDPRHGTGFKFREYSAGALVETVAVALDYYRQRPEQWRRMMDNAFAADFSWVHSARRYRQLYRETYRKKFGSYPPPARSSGTG